MGGLAGDRPGAGLASAHRPRKSLSSRRLSEAQPSNQIDSRWLPAEPGLTEIGAALSSQYLQSPTRAQLIAELEIHRVVNYFQSVRVIGQSAGRATSVVAPAPLGGNPLLPARAGTSKLLVREPRRLRTFSQPSSPAGGFAVCPGFLHWYAWCPAAAARLDGSRGERTTSLAGGISRRE